MVGVLAGAIFLLLSLSVPAEDQTLFLRTLTPGFDAIELYVDGPPELQWLCGPIEVTEQS